MQRLMRPLEIHIGRRKQWVQGDSEGGVQHDRYQPTQHRTISLKARISIRLYQINSKILIDHKIKAENFEAEIAAAGIYFSEGHCPKRFRDQVPNLRQNLLQEIYATVLSLKLGLQILRYLQILLKIGKAQLIARFKLPEIVRCLLNRVIC